MRFMVLVPGDEGYEEGRMPSEQELAAMGKFNEELVKAGVMLAGEGLHPTKKGAKLVFGQGKPRVVDGPFAETKEVLGGFWLIQTKTREEAIEWMSRAPFGPGVTIVLRQVFEPSDFTASDPPSVPAPRADGGELRAKEAELRKKIETRG